MGKRKKAAKKPQGPKKNAPLPTSFTCLFCNHEKSIIVKLDKKSGVGQLSCKVCGQSFQTGINYLSAAVDVFSDWVDACEFLAKKSDQDAMESPSFSSHRNVNRGAPVSSQVMDTGLNQRDDGFLDDDGGREEVYANE
ncbi:MAG: hypothetical protein M1837_000300 [Sclerophora amabilis]|nr:MAG: hypothetical protein M1837_000300 [Sclerophora amabilis]